MEKYVTPNEWNDIIQDLRGLRKFILGKEQASFHGHIGSFLRGYINEDRGWATLRVRQGKKDDTYKCALCENPNYTGLYTQVIAQQIGKYVKPYIHDLSALKDKFQDGPNLRYWDNKYRKKIVKIYAYDLNSAYTFAMLQDWPDTTKPLGPGELEENEIGFRHEYVLEGDNEFQRLIAIFNKGEYCEHRFKIMPCPDKVKEYNMKHYKGKSTAKDKPTKDKEKAYLNILAGDLRNINPFVRSTVLTRCKNYVESFFDENTVYANIDCLYSLTPRPELPIGTGIGQFKQELNGEEWMHNGVVHGTNDDPRWSGVPRSWFKGDFFDCVLNDKVPPNRNIYRIDRNTNFIILNTEVEK